MKRVVLIVSLLAIAAVFAPTFARHGATAVAATPTPAALQYDEINRPVIPTASPPAPGSFQADYQAIVASSPKGAPPKHRGGLGGIINSVMSGQPPDAGDPEAMMRMMQMGKLTRYTYYKGWLRTDDPVAQTATIEKCDQHQFITLNLAAKTYTVSSTQPACQTPAMPMGRGGRPGNSEPGTVDMTIKGSAQNLGPLTIDGIPTIGADQSMELAMTNATGSCSNGDIKMQMIQYVSQIAIPRAYCPLPRSMGAGAMMGGGGCEPTMKSQVSGMGFGGNGKLVMYSRMIPPNTNMSVVVERGNVKWLSGAPADALFAIPEGFTQQS